MTNARIGFVVSLFAVANGAFAAERPGSHVSAKPSFLPNWFDEKSETRDGLPPQFSAPLLAPPSDFRVPAEYEPISAVVLGWTGYTPMLGEIARVIGEHTQASVWAASGPASLPGVPRERYLRSDCPINSLWVRDYGPVGLSQTTGEIGLVDSVYRHYQSRRSDDAVPTCLAQSANVSAYGVDLVLDGGNFLIDSQGNLFTTERTYIWNKKYSRDEVNAILRKTYAAREVFALPYAGFPREPADGTGHIDMYVKLLSDDVVLISEANTEPFIGAVNKAIEFFRSRTAPNGAPYKILRIPGWERNGTWYTYTNSLLVNGVALVPAYGSSPERNEEARRVYEQAGFKAILINSDNTIRSGGSIHCVTQTVPAGQ